MPEEKKGATGERLSGRGLKKVLTVKNLMLTPKDGNFVQSMSLPEYL